MLFVQDLLALALRQSDLLLRPYSIVSPIIPVPDDNIFSKVSDLISSFDIVVKDVCC